MTGREMIAASLRLIGAIASGETPSADEASDGLSSLNRLIDSWSNEGLTIYAITAESPLTLTGGDATYTLGTSGDITTRPMKIEKAVIRDGSTDYPITVRSIEEYAAIPNKTIQSTYPTDLYDDGGYPQRTLTLYPVPSASKQLVLWTRRPLTQIATLDTSISFPPGYDRALIFNHALDLAPEYGKTVPDAVAIGAVESKAAIKRANQRARYLRCDSGVMTRTRGHDRRRFESGDY